MRRLIFEWKINVICDLIMILFVNKLNKEVYNQM